MSSRSTKPSPRRSGMHAGIVDLASFNVMNAVIGAGAAPASATGCSWPWRRRRRRSPSCRGPDLMFYRHRAAVDEEPLSALVHQTAMYHEDRLGGTRSAASGCAAAASASAEQARRDISARLGRAGRSRGRAPGRGDRRDRIDGVHTTCSMRWPRRSACCCAIGRRPDVMLRGNLSSRPFYNERLVTLVLAARRAGRRSRSRSST